MKTPTLIVRLSGLCLLVNCAIVLFKVHQIQATPLVALMSQSQSQVVGDFQALAWLGLMIGLAAVAFAGPLARVLTFDSEAKEEASDHAYRLPGHR